MGEGQTKGNREAQSVSPLEAYDILLRRHVSEDRIVTERTGVFLAGSSILFLAFVMLLNPDLAPIFRWLRILLPLVGICLTVVLYLSCKAADYALSFWHGAERKIEDETSEFNYMRENNITPHTDADTVINGKKNWERTKEGLRLKDTEGWSRWVRSLYFPYRSRYTILRGLLIPLFSLFCILWLGSLVVGIISLFDC